MRAVDFFHIGLQHSPSSSTLEYAAELKAQRAEGWVIVGTATEWPVIFALAFLDLQIVDAGDAPPHQAVLIELPVFVAVAAKPVAGIVVPFISKAYGDPVVTERPHFLDEPIIEFATPFAGEEGFNRLAAADEFGAIPPDAVDGVSERDAGRITGVPGILGEARLLRGGLRRERGQWRAGHRLTPSVPCLLLSAPRRTSSHHLCPAVSI